MPRTNDPQVQGPERDALWNRNFFLLWQGQSISVLGDVVYAIALGFWVLGATGSTALMGTLMAASSLPRVLVSPFAGVIVDRSDRKRLLILMDVVRGACVILVALAAYIGAIHIWMVFAVAVMIGLGAAFFNPAVSSLLPDIVKPGRLVQANSVYSMIFTGSAVVGNSAGGFLFKLLGAPFLFLFNGLSYFFSAVSVLFVKIPRRERPHEKSHFFADMKEGMVFVWRFRGLRDLVFLIAILNFFAFMGVMLILPLFERHKQLGPGNYGLVMAFLTGGMLLGYLLASVYRFKPENRFRLFVIGSMLNAGGMILFPVFLHWPVMACLAFVTGVANAILNSFIMAVAQMTVPQDKRGKVFGLLGSISGGLAPLAFAAGGFLAEFIPIRPLISGSFLVTLLLFLPLFASSAFRRFINFNPELHQLEDIL